MYRCYMHEYYMQIHLVHGGSPPSDVNVCLVPPQEYNR
jgi:hypothetical protein